MPGEKRYGWEDAEVMQLVWTRHDKDEDVRSQTRLQGQNRDVSVWLELKRHHPAFRHKFATVKAKLFHMEAHWRKASDLLLEPSGKRRPPKIPIYYDIYDRIFGDRANARPHALVGSLPGANVIGTPLTTPGIAGSATGGCGIWLPAFSNGGVAISFSHAATNVRAGSAHHFPCAPRVTHCSRSLAVALTRSRSVA
ncbi:unnamed protein product [Closterium sp. NIES-53]